MSVAAFRAAPRHRVLPDPGLRADDADRDLVVGVLLDQHRRQSGARLTRSTHRTDNDDHERRRARVAAQSVLHQSDRCLDDHVPGLCLRVADRVRRRQRCRPSAGQSQTGATAANNPHTERSNSGRVVARRQPYRHAAGNTSSLACHVLLLLPVLHQSPFSSIVIYKFISEHHIVFHVAVQSADIIR